MDYEKKIKVIFNGEKKEFEFIEKYDDLIKKIKEIFNIPNNTKLTLYNIDLDNDKLNIENQSDYELCDGDHLGNLLFEIHVNSKLNNEEKKDKNSIYDNNEKQNISNKKEKDKISFHKENKINISDNNNFEYDNLFENKSDLNQKNSNLSFNEFLNSFIDYNNIGNEELIKEFQNQFDKKFEKIENKIKEYINLKINEIYHNIDEKLNSIYNVLNKNSFSTTTDISEKNFLTEKCNNESFSIFQKSNFINIFQCEFILSNNYHEINLNQPENQFIQIEIKNLDDKMLPKNCYIKSKGNEFISIYEEINQYIKPNEKIKINCKISVSEIQEFEEKKISLELIIGHKNNNYRFKYNKSILFIRIIKSVKSKFQRNIITFKLNEKSQKNNNKKNIINNSAFIKKMKNTNK